MMIYWVLQSCGKENGSLWRQIFGQVSRPRLGPGSTNVHTPVKDEGRNKLTNDQYRGSYDHM